MNNGESNEKESGQWIEIGMCTDDYQHVGSKFRV